MNEQSKKPIIDPLDVLKSQAIIKTLKNSNKIPSNTPEYSANQSDVAKLSASSNCRDDGSSKTRSGTDANLKEYTTIKLTGRREMRSQKRNRGALHGRGEEQLSCQCRPRCGERDIKVKRDRRVTRRREAGLKKESDCGEDLDRNKRWLWR